MLLDIMPILVIRIFITILVATLARVLTRFLIKVLVTNIVKNIKGIRKINLEARSGTIKRFMDIIADGIIVVAFIITILSLFGIDAGTLITGAGAIGIIVGLGLQTLIKDFVSGLLTMLENQYFIGETVTINGVIGEVIDITVRSTILREKSGILCYIPHGSIAQVENHSRK